MPTWMFIECSPLAEVTTHGWKLAKQLGNVNEAVCHEMPYFTLTLPHAIDREQRRAERLAAELLQH